MMIAGIDDTDTLDSPGTNHVARGIVADIEAEYRCLRIVRHQLLFDPRVPYTRKNSCCSLLLEPRVPHNVPALFESLSAALRKRFQPGSDPGLCLAASVPQDAIQFGLRCQREVVRQVEARDLAGRLGIPLAGLGGTEDGVIGALAAVGLAASENDGRVVQIEGQPDDLSGDQPVELLLSRGVGEVRCQELARKITTGIVDVGKHLRPNLRGGRIVLFVEPIASRTDYWRAVRFP
jgi:hypothetical protein